jgi:hypothetical protein
VRGTSLQQRAATVDNAWNCGHRRGFGARGAPVSEWMEASPPGLAKRVLPVWRAPGPMSDTDEGSIPSLPPSWTPSPPSPTQVAHTRPMGDRNENVANVLGPDVASRVVNGVVLIRLQPELRRQ